MEERNDIVIYKSEDGLVKMEAMVDPVNETIWANQKAIAALFDVTVPNISYHFKKIFKSGELDAGTVVKDFLITAQSGARGTSDEKVKYYNLDAIISIGYRINSFRATKFRIWATQVLKQYMLKGFAINRNAVSEQKYEDLKKAVGLLENVFSKELLLTSDQTTDLFDVIRDYTYALDTLDAYDYQSLKIADTTVPERFHATYENAIQAIQSLKEDSALAAVADHMNFTLEPEDFYAIIPGDSIEEKASKRRQIEADGRLAGMEEYALKTKALNYVMDNAMVKRVDDPSVEYVRYGDVSSVVQSAAAEYPDAFRM